MKKEAISTRRAQVGIVYIIAAVIILIAVLGIASISNYVSIREEPIGFYDLSSNLEVEGPIVIDYGVYKSEKVNSVVKSFTDKYADYMKGTGETNFSLVIVYGDKNQANVTTYSQGFGGGITAGGLDMNLPIIAGLTSTTMAVPGGRETLNITIEGYNYVLALKEDENFLFVLTTNRDFERYVFEKTE